MLPKGLYLLSNCFICRYKILGHEILRTNSKFVDDFILQGNQRLETQLNLPKMTEGGLDVAWLIVYTGQDSLTETGYAKAKANAMSKFDAIHKLCNELAKDKIELALTSDDVRRIDASGKKVAMIGVENAYPIGTDLSEFEKYHKLKKAVNEMNRLGMMIDISHPSKKSMEQMIQLSKAPIIASHSSARALCNHSRNLDDDQLKLLKENGGVVQTVAFSSYLNTDKHEARAAFMKGIYKNVADSLGVNWYERSQFATLTEAQIGEYMENRPKVLKTGNDLASKIKDAPPAVDVGDFVDHIDYMVKLIGIDHVGISSDFDGGGGIEGWRDASETFNVTHELVKRGYTEDEIEQLWGGNLLRVLDEVQAIAGRLQKG